MWEISDEVIPSTGEFAGVHDLLIRDALGFLSSHTVQQVLTHRRGEHHVLLRHSGDTSAQVSNVVLLQGFAVQTNLSKLRIVPVLVFEFAFLVI